MPPASPVMVVSPLRPPKSVAEAGAATAIVAAVAKAAPARIFAITVMFLFDETFIYFMIFSTPRCGCSYVGPAVIGEHRQGGWAGEAAGRLPKS